MAVARLILPVDEHAKLVELCNEARWSMRNPEDVTRLSRAARELNRAITRPGKRAELTAHELRVLARLPIQPPLLRAAVNHALGEAEDSELRESTRRRGVYIEPRRSQQ